MSSPITHLIHIPKTAGNSIWRELINHCDNAAEDSNYVIKLDSRHFVDTDYWNKMYSKSDCREYKNNTIYDPQIGLGILANKDMNLILKRQNLLQKHRILIHHHNSGVLRLPIKNSILMNETSSHIWKSENCPNIYVLTLRETLNRTISHLKHSFRANITVDKFKKELSKRAIWNGACDSDFLPRDRRAIIEMVSIKLRNENLSENDSINWGIEVLPELATYQLRYILTLVCSKNPNQTLNILWHYSNDEIQKLWEDNASYIKELISLNKLGLIFLDQKKNFKINKNFINFLGTHYGVSNFQINQVFKKTASPNKSSSDKIKIDNYNFMKFVAYEKNILEELFVLN